MDLLATALAVATLGSLVAAAPATASAGVPAGAQAMPTATSTARPPDNCPPAPRTTVTPTTIIATGSADVVVSGEPHTQVHLYAYSRPSTDYRLVRSGEVSREGRIQFQIAPATNTRLFAEQSGCAAGPQVVLNVRTLLTLNVVRNGTRDYTFGGRAMPQRAEGLVISLYRVEADGRQILTAQSRVSTDGGYAIRRKFSGSGRFGFVVRTGQDLQNAPGSSNVRSLLVY